MESLQVAEQTILTDKTHNLSRKVYKQTQSRKKQANFPSLMNINYILIKERNND
jgi:hypothetical protein